MKKNTRPIIFIMLCMLFAAQSKSQPPSRFYTRFGGSGYDYGYDLKQTLDKGYIIVGSTSSYGQGNTDVYLVKLDSMGTKIWQQTFGNYNNEIGKSIVQLSDSGYVMAGYTNSSGFGGYDFYMVRTDKLGNLLWQKTYGGTDWDFAYSLKQTSDGGFVMCGTTYSYGRGGADGYVIKTDASGNVTWTKTYGGANDDEFKSIVQTSDGGYALAGYTKSYTDVNGDAWIFKLGAAGDSTWSQLYGGSSEDYANDIIQHTTGEYYVAGATASYGLGMLDGYGLKLTAIGGLIWQQEDGHANSDEVFYKVLVPRTDNTHSIFLEKDNFPSFGIQVKIIELNAGGYYYYAANYGDVLADEFYSFVNTRDKGYACVGYTYGYNAEIVDVYFLKTDSVLAPNPQSIVSVKEETASNNIKIYPTICKDYVMIQSPNVNMIGKLNFQLFNSNGIEINNSDYEFEKTNATQLRVNFNLSNGLYFIRINDFSEKIIVSN